MAAESPIVPEIGKYRLVAELARGGMGIVHLAVAQGPGGFNKLLAVKELKPELAGDESYVAMFLDEARLAARLTHRNIVQTIEVGSEGSRPFLVMEYLDGRSLHRIARRLSEAAGGLATCAHLRIVAETLRGLHYAHELRDFDGAPLGIVHRDVSPLNVFVTFDGQVKVIDFGIAKWAESSQKTQTGILKGRIAYMAPEQAWGPKVDRRADVYSAGVMIWEAVAGQRLWPGMNEVEILSRLLREGPPPLRSACRAPADLERICARAMARRPEDRYESAAALAEDLEEHVARRPDAMSTRDLGDLLAHVFEDERRTMDALVEETLARTRGGPRSGVTSTLERHVRGTPSGACGPSAEPSVSSGAPIPSSRRPAPATASSVPAVAATGAPPGMSTQVASGRSAAAMGAAIGVLVSVPLVAISLSSRGPSATAAATTPQGTASAAAAAAPLPPDESVAPRVEEAVSREPIDVVVERRAAPPAHIWVRPAVMHLHHAAPPPSPAPPPAESAAPFAAPAHTDVPPSGGHAPLRPIVTSNPYGGS